MGYSKEETIEKKRKKKKDETQNGSQHTQVQNSLDLLNTQLNTEWPSLHR